MKKQESVLVFVILTIQAPVWVREVKDQQRQHVNQFSEVQAHDKAFQLLQEVVAQVRGEANNDFDAE